MKASEHFLVQEFVSPEIFNAQGINPIWFVSKQQIKAAEFIKDYFSTLFKKEVFVTINNWHKGGPLKNRGTRAPWTETGGKLSQHKFMNGFDFNVSGMTSDEVYDHIMANQAPFLAAGITTIEDKAMTQGWTHIDFRITGMDHLFVVKP
jgi:hypothetical protein